MTPESHVAGSCQQRPCLIAIAARPSAATELIFWLLPYLNIPARYPD